MGVNSPNDPFTWAYRTLRRADESDIVAGGGRRQPKDDCSLPDFRLAAKTAPVASGVRRGGLAYSRGVFAPPRNPGGAKFPPTPGGDLGAGDSHTAIRAIRDESGGGNGESRGSTGCEGRRLRYPPRRRPGNKSTYLSLPEKPAREPRKIKESISPGRRANESLYCSLEVVVAHRWREEGSYSRHPSFSCVFVRAWSPSGVLCIP